MSREGQKEAAARDLLKVDAARVRKAATAPMRKAPGRVRDGAAPLLEQRTSGGATHVPEQRASSGAAHVGAYGAGGFFNGGAGGFFGNSGRSPIQPWMSQPSDPSTWLPGCCLMPLVLLVASG
ncbi:hypothetical protein PVAP13_9NG331211 [Panicum virgatum]|uniref:Uncharacterized protein n=1 Tax=Panicum virgatum TaxID=38727 RepID=A0A8T0MNK4_PANVG|nr:hypothetical protein PVAP13_9NG331211 [Panicum virgatum]